MAGKITLANILAMSLGYCLTFALEISSIFINEHRDTFSGPQLFTAVMHYGLWTNKRLGLTEEFERIQSRVM